MDDDFGPFPSLTWSASRHRTLRVCRRRYYHRYYGSWRGWEEEADAGARRTYLLKQLTGLRAELGKAVHRRAFEVGFRAAQGLGLPGVEELLARTRDELNQVVLSSRDRAGFLRHPARHAFLRSSWYGDGPSEEQIVEVEELLEPVHRRLREHELWALVAEGAVEVEHLSDPDVVPEAAMAVDGVPIYAEPDMLLRDEAEGRRTVVDWKTGRQREADLLQAAVYGLYVQETLGDGACVARVEYLTDGSSLVEELGDEELRRARQMVGQSLEEMQALLSDADRNEPKARDAFPLTDQRSVCAWCDFYELCAPELEARGEALPDR